MRAFSIEALTEMSSGPVSMIGSSAWAGAVSLQLLWLYEQQLWEQEWKVSEILVSYQIENIRQTGGSDLAQTHQVLVEQLRIYSKKLGTLENASLNDAT